MQVITLVGALWGVGIGLLIVGAPLWLASLPLIVGTLVALVSGAALLAFFPRRKS